MDAIREFILKQLLQEKSPWIDNPRALDKIIIRLTSEYKPQSMEDLERLYHSCRLEREVTKEALLYLKVRI